MSGRVKLGLRELDIHLKIKAARKIIESMSGNHNFPEPDPPLVEIEDSISLLEKKYSELLHQRQLVQRKSFELNNAEGELDKKLTILASYVESKAIGAPAIIKSAGMELRADSSPVGVPERVKIKAVKESVNFGEIKLNWEKVRGAKVYNIEYSDNIKIESHWKVYDSTTKTKIFINHLISETKYWFRVQAIGSAGKGPYSDPVVKYAP